jgi:neural Wiskott-Aldrich syndrome protein
MPQSFADAFKSFPISPQLGESLERAHRFAREQSHRLVTLEHLLLALTEDAEAVDMLQSANVDLARLAADVSGYLGGLLEDMRAHGEAELAPDIDLLRVLKAATTAAQQSRRRHIDGAIVLAAIVGDGKSAAAGLLKGLGLTFEGAIRALQRASTEARVKAASQPAWPPPNVSARTAAVTQPAPGADPAPPPASGQISLASSAEEFLAAARARIQQRAAAARASETPSAPVRTLAAAEKAVAEAAKPASPALPTSRGERNPGNLAAALRDVAAEPASDLTPTAPPASPEASHEAAAAAKLRPAAGAPEAGRTGETAPAGAPPAVKEPLPQTHAAGRPPPHHRQPVPLPGRPLRAAEGPARPPLPPGPNPARGAPPGLIARGGRPGRGPNGTVGPALPPARPAGLPLQPPLPDPAGAIVVPLQPRTAPASAGYPERGPLVESVPRRMQSGRPASAEVRIARDKIDGLMLALLNRGVRPEVYPTRTLAVRLRAPNGGFSIEANAPETQWIDRSGSNLSDGFAAWRWTITPQHRGRNRLLLTVSARLIGPDGLVAEAAPSDRAIEVRVGANYRRLAQRWTGWLAALLAGVALAQFGGELWAAAGYLLRQLASG